MKKYNLDKFEDFLPGAAGIIGVSRDNKIFMFDAEEWHKIATNPKAAFRKYVVQAKNYMACEVWRWILRRMLSRIL